MRKRFKGDKNPTIKSKYGAILELRKLRWGKNESKVWEVVWVCAFCGARIEDKDDKTEVRNHKCS